MARSRAIEHYPAEYLRLVERVGEELESVEMKLPDRIAAMKVRGHFYAFVGALRKAKSDAVEARVKRAREEASLGKALTLENPNSETYIRLADVVDKVMITITKEGLLFQRRENSWQAQLLRQALEASGTHSTINGLVDPAEAERRMREKFVEGKGLEPVPPVRQEMPLPAGTSAEEMNAKLERYGFRKKY